MVQVHSGSQERNINMNEKEYRKEENPLDDGFLRGIAAGFVLFGLLGIALFVISAILFIVFLFLGL